MTTKRSLLAGLLAAPAVLLPGEALAREAAARSRSKTPAGGRRGFPNVTLLTHEGRKVRFYDDLVKGKVVMFNVFYATCDGICPLGTANLKELQGRLGDRVGRDIYMYSLTLKPAVDTPDVLKQYAIDNGLGPGWTLLTGDPRNCDAVRRRLGFALTDPEEDADITQHTGSVTAGNEPLDRWMSCSAMIPAAEIARSIAVLGVDVGKLPEIR